MIFLALGSAGVWSQESKGAAWSAGTSASTPANSAAALSAGSQRYVAPELVGIYLPDGTFKKTSRRKHLVAPVETSGRRSLRPIEVPVYVNLHPAEHVVEDYLPPAPARTVYKQRSRMANARDDFITFVYGRERALVAPTHVTTDSKRRLIVTDPAQPALHVLDGARSFRIVGGPRRRLLRPKGVAVDAEDNIYVADGERGMVLIYEPHGKFLRYLASPNLRSERMFQGPTGVAIDRQAGHVYVLDSPAHELVMLDLQGNVLKRVGSFRDKKSGVRFDYPTEVAIGNQALAVLDLGGSRLQVLDLDCKRRAGFHLRAAGFLPPVPEMGLALDSAGNIYVSNAGSSEVRIYRQDGQFIGSFGHGGIAGIWVDSGNRIYAADTQHGRVQVFRSGAAAKPGAQPGE